MVPRLFTSSSNGWKFTAVLIALTGILLVEVVLGLVAPESDMVMYFDLVRELVTQKTNVVVEVFGDSVSRTGIWAGVLQEELGDSVVVENYSLQGSGPIFSYFLLRDQVDAGTAPRYIIYAHSPHTYAGVRFPVLVGSFATWGETGELLVSGGDPYEVVYGVLTRMFYTLRYREQLDRATRGDASFFTEPREIYFGDELYAHEKAHVRRQDFSIELPDRYVEPFTVSDLNRLYFDRFVALAEANDITILWVTMPLPQTVYNARRADGFMDDYYAFVDSIESEHVVMLQPEFTVLDNKYFRDHSHMNADGGIEFTKQLAAKLAPIMHAGSAADLQHTAAQVQSSPPQTAH